MGADDIRHQQKHSPEELVQSFLQISQFSIGLFCFPQRDTPFEKEVVKKVGDMRLPVLHVLKICMQSVTSLLQHCSAVFNLGMKN